MNLQNPIWAYFFKPPKESMSQAKLLAGLSVFSGLSRGEIVQVERMLHERRYGPGERVFQEGDPGAAMYVVEKGEVAITQTVDGGHTMQLAVIGSDSFFGELALLDEIPRSASAIAKTETFLLAFSEPDLEKLIERNPRLGVKILRNLSRLVCQRLLKANENQELLQARLNSLAKPETTSTPT